MLPLPLSLPHVIDPFLISMPHSHRARFHHDHKFDSGRKTNARYATKLSHLKALMAAKIHVNLTLLSALSSTSRLPRLDQPDHIPPRQQMQR